MRQRIVVLMAAAAFGAALADPPPPSCAVGSPSGCAFTSDRLVFAEGDAAYRIEARIDGCQSCVPVAGSPGEFTFTGDARVSFGPYLPGLCPGDYSHVAYLAFASFGLRPGVGASGEATYVPRVPTQSVFPEDLDVPLATQCVGSRNLRIEIPAFRLTGANGAESFGPGSPAGDPAFLHFPGPVLARDAAGTVDAVALDAFRFTQALGLQAGQSQPPGTSLRLRPEGLPFELTPAAFSVTEEDATFTLQAPDYVPKPPNASSTSSLEPDQVVSCTSPDPSVPCTVSTVANDAYLLASWNPSNAGFSSAGISVDLRRNGGDVVYEPLFPARMQVRLSGPAHVAVRENRIVGGDFESGEVFYGGDRDKCGSRPRRRFVLGTDGGRPQLEEGGAILAEVRDLNLDGWTGEVAPIPWTFNSVEGLGCGTFYAPPAFSDDPPYRAAYRSPVPTVLGRGIHAGINYNRTRACHASDGTMLQRICTSDAGCDGAAGETCRDAGHAPRCGPRTTNPLWNTTIEGTEYGFLALPDLQSYADHEIAFVLRGSGMTGVFDAGNIGVDLGGPEAGSFDVNVAGLGLAFRTSRAELGDTITTGRVDLPWPADTDVPFDGMRVCDCGTLGGGRTPEVLLERTLGYWNQTFLPTGLHFFSPDPADPDADDCAAIANYACTTDTSPSTRACIDAVMPVPRFEPDVQGSFDVTPQGQVGEMAIAAEPQLIFDRNRAASQPAGWPFDTESITFSTWPPAATESAVRGGSALYGFVDIQGELGLPFFGRTDAALLSRYSRTADDFTVNTHERCDVGTNPDCGGSAFSSFPANRPLGGETVDLTYRVDYVPAGRTSFAGDGATAAGFGTGSFFGYGAEYDERFGTRFDLGSVEVASALVMRHDAGVVGDDADLGAGAIPRLWASLAGDDFQKVGSLATIVPAALLGPNPRAAYGAALAKLGYPDGSAPDLPPPAILADRLIETGAMDALETVSDADVLYNMEGASAGATPPVRGRRASGWLDLSPSLGRAEAAYLGADMDTGGKFYAFDASWLTVERFVKDGGEEPITSVTRRQRAGAGNRMSLPGGQDIAFPSGGAKSSDSPLTWDVDFGPNFQFESMTGTLDLTKGGLSGVGFDKLGATLKFYADGDWYFTAGMRGNWDGYAMNADALFGNTVDMTPLREIDPDVARFLQGIDKFQGAYLGGGLSAPIVNYGCFLRITAGVQVGGWFLSEAFGGKVRGWISGTGACLVSVRGDLTLLGGVQDDVFKVAGKFWVGGGIGFCSPEDWDSPAEALDDDFCAVCVATLRASGSYPPEDLNLKVGKPRFQCTL